MAFYVALATKLERAARALLILQGKSIDSAAFSANGDTFISMDSRTRSALPNRTCIVVANNPMRRHRPEGILSLQIQHHLPAPQPPDEANPEAQRLAADTYLGDTCDTMGLGNQDNDDIMQPLADALTAAGRWLATPPADPVADPIGAQIAANNADMANFRVDWIRRARPFHTRGNDQDSTNWVEILHFEAGCSYAANGP